MKMIKFHENGFEAVGFKTLFANYGKMFGTYRLELTAPGIEKSLTIYKSPRKPMFRRVYALWIFAIPLSVLVYLFIGITITVLLFFSFYVTCLFKQSFINDGWETLSGYISLILSIVGLISIILWII